ncbi:MAG: aspartate 1-decarboxylase [Planctomycetota bacterium]|jgi:aspartate 1-decarboxylase|nr:aspartate 1-decarboxylase [Planctomycetota bacterium]
MQVAILKSKIHRATITETSLHYEGSITLPRRLVELANMRVFEKVLVANVENGNRFETYVILGDDGQICLNGAAAHLGKPGDKIIVMAWGIMDEREAEKFTPAVVLVDGNNQPKKPL